LTWPGGRNLALWWLYGTRYETGEHYGDSVILRFNYGNYPPAGQGRQDDQPFPVLRLVISVADLAGLRDWVYPRGTPIRLSLEQLRLLDTDNPRQHWRGGRPTVALYQVPPRHLSAHGPVPP